MDDKSLKQDLLEEALVIVTGPRQQLYGNPSQNFIDTAEIMSSYLHARGLLPRDVWLEAYDTAVLVNCLKMARIATSPLARDHWVDTAGYAACGYEAAVGSASPTPEVQDSQRCSARWDQSPDEKGSVLQCRLDRDHPGDHRSGDTTWWGD